MDDNFSASQSAKTGTATDDKALKEIVAQETKEHARVQKETDAFAAEFEKKKKESEERIASAEQEQKEAAKEDLKKYKADELSTVLSSAESNAESKAAALQSAFDQKGAELTKKLANHVQDSYSTAA